METTCTLQITVPQQRMTPLKTAWLSLYTPITEQLHLDMRMNLKSKKVRSGHVTYRLQATLWYIFALSEGVLQ